jgi:hypothetical protein
VTKAEKTLHEALAHAPHAHRLLARFLYELAPCHIQMLGECEEYATMLQEVAVAVSSDYGSGKLKRLVRRANAETREPANQSPEEPQSKSKEEKL